MRHILQPEYAPRSASRARLETRACTYVRDSFRKTVAEAQSNGLDDAVESICDRRQPTQTSQAEVVYVDLWAPRNLNHHALRTARCGRTLRTSLRFGEEKSPARYASATVVGTATA